MMRIILIVIVVLVGFNMNAQEENVLSGQLRWHNFHQGGMEQIYDTTTYVYSNQRLLVVEYIDSAKKSKVVGEILTDENGNFAIKLPPGKYGFITPNEKPGKGQFLPAAVSNGSQWESRAVNWKANFKHPIDLFNSDQTGILLVRYESSVCYTCP